MRQKEKTRCKQEQKIESIKKPGGQKQHGESEVPARMDQKQKRRAGKTVGRKSRSRNGGLERRK
jgi:hypothetical protein